MEETPNQSATVNGALEDLIDEHGLALVLAALWAHVYGLHDYNARKGYRKEAVRLYASMMKQAAKMYTTFIEGR